MKIHIWNFRRGIIIVYCKGNIFLIYGFKCYYVHDAIAYHGRGMNSSKGVINTIKNRRSQSEFLKGISFRNHYLMIMKNETSYAFEKDKIKIYIGAMKYLVFFMIFDWKCLLAQKLRGIYLPQYL